MRGLGRVGFNNLDILDEDDRVGKEKTIDSKCAGISSV